MQTTVEKFKKTTKQKEAVKLIAAIRYAMLFGGSRSGKTFIALRSIIIRAAKEPKSDHLICRLRFNHVKRSIAQETLPKVMELCFPELPYHLDKTDWYVSLPNGARIWFAGTDDKARIEKVLGTEFSTIYFNETSQFLDYDIITTVLTRLAQKNGLTKRALFDCNPPGKKHWTYRLFFEHVDPVTGEKIKYPEEYGHILMNPIDNMDNIDEGYIRMLENMSKRQRQRFLEGQFLSDVEGALWTDQMVVQAKAKVPGAPVKTVIAVDPAVSNNPNSDECGIHACSLDDNGDGIVHEDLSIKASTKTWAQRAVNAYYKYDANEIVAEVNQGGDLVEDAIKAIDPTIKVVKVRASKGKFARAEPISALYELGKVAHIDDMPKTEAELTEWVPMNTKESPNRLDSLVWGLTHLMLHPTKKREVRAFVMPG
jgi:phage terminase large subunit-like protein